MYEYWICAALLIIIVYLALHAAAAYADAIAAGGGKGILAFSDAYDELCSRVAHKTFQFTWSAAALKLVVYCICAWFVGSVYYFTTRRNYIMGKEYGSARWAGKNDLADVTAANLAKNEIRMAKRVSTPFGRYFVKRKAYRECEEACGLLKSERLVALKDWIEAEKDEGNKVGKPIARTKKKIILDLYFNELQHAKGEAWPPDKIHNQYKTDVMLTVGSYKNKLVDKEGRDKSIRAAKRKKEKALKDFYSIKRRIKKIKAKYANADAIFTKTERISIHNYKLNNNTLIIGGSGSGKTRSFVMPNILQAHSSFVVTDPKGEILEKAGYFLSTVKHYKIRVLNLDNKSKSDNYNPFAYIHTEREGYEERVLMLIEAIILNTDGGEKKSSSDPFWDKAERLFLQAVFFFVCDGFVKPEQNMNTVLYLIGLLQLKEDGDDFDSGLDRFANSFEKRRGGNHIGVQQYKEFRQKASGKTAKSIVISAVARLAPFRTTALRRIFASDAMNLDKIGEELTAVFVVVPPTDSTFNFIAGMLFTQMFQELQHCAAEVHKHEGQRLPVPVRFILDEFANTCVIPQFIKILAYARSFGIGIVPILQSLEQIKTMYKDEWGVVVDNCNTLLFLGSVSHMDTLEYISKLLGKGTYDKKTSGRTHGKQGSTSKNWDVIGRELMDAAEIRKLPKENCLLVVGGRSPFYSLKYDYASHPNYRYTSDGNKLYSYDYDPAGPEKERLDEAI